MFDEIAIYCTDETEAGLHVINWMERFAGAEIIRLGPNIMQEMRDVFQVSDPFVFIPVTEEKNWSRIAIGVGAGGLLSIFAAPIVLSAVGFTSAGVSGGSIAAGIQSVFYGGATGGVFSVLQSAGAAGIGFFGNVGLYTSIIGGSAGYGLTKFLGKSNEDVPLSNDVKIIGLYRGSNEETDKELIKKFVVDHLGLTVDHIIFFREGRTFTNIIDRTEELKTPAILIYLSGEQPQNNAEKSDKFTMEK